MKPVTVLISLTALTGLVLIATRKTENNFEQHLLVDNSDIQGKGLFATTNIPTGSKIYKAIAPGNRITPFASNMNHSDYPNTKIICTGNEYWQYAVKDIVPGEEITSDYRLAPPFVNRDVSNFK